MLALIQCSNEELGSVWRARKKGKQHIHRAVGKNSNDMVENIIKQSSMLAICAEEKKNINGQKKKEELWLFINISG